MLARLDRRLQALMPPAAGFIQAHPMLALLFAALGLIVLGGVLRRRAPWLGNLLRMVGRLALIVPLLMLVARFVHYPIDFGSLSDAQPEQSITGSVTRVRLGADGHFWVRGIADGTSKRFLIDTGATLTTLSTEAADAMDVEPDAAGDHITLTTANGTTTADLGRIAALHVGNIVVRNLEVAVAPGLNGTNVLGMNFLSQLESWRVEGGTLILVPHHPQPASDRSEG